MWELNWRAKLKKLLLAAALLAGAPHANAAVVTTFSSLGSPTDLPAGSTSVVDFSSLTPGLPYNGGAVYNTGGGTTTGITNPSSFVAAPWTSIPVAFPPGSGFTGNFFADNNGDSSAWSFGAGEHTIYLYIGSLDAGNSLTITASNGTTVFTGSDWTTIPGVTLPGDGDPTIMGSTSNGWFRFTDTGGTISSLTTAETGSDLGNSFEIAAIAVSPSVPEPSTWAMLLIGFAGLAYAGSRRTKRATLSVA
jgi:PEP-CTERM motif